MNERYLKELPQNSLSHATQAERPVVHRRTVAHTAVHGGHAACAWLRPLQHSCAAPCTAVPPCTWFFWLSQGFI